jgi:hypothetical protein
MKKKTRYFVARFLGTDNHYLNPGSVYPVQIRFGRYEVVNMNLDQIYSGKLIADPNDRKKYFEFMGWLPKDISTFFSEGKYEGIDRITGKLVTFEVGRDQFFVDSNTDLLGFVYPLQVHTRVKKIVKIQPAP